MATTEVSETTENLTETSTAEDSSVLENKIIRQVEYYFGNYNLCKDRFLREQVKLNDGWVPMETMLKFNRLKMLSSDSAVITEALKKSPNQLLEVNEDGTQIRRNPLKPIPENTDEHKKEVIERSIYAKGFKLDTRLDELEEFFEQYGSVESIMMKRRQSPRKFKGSVFVTFSTVEIAKKFLDSNGTKFKGTEVLKESKEAYLKRKEIQYAGRLKAKEERKRKLSEKEKEDEKEEEISAKKAKTAEEVEITKGCLLRLSGLQEGTMWEHIKDVLKPHGSIAYVDYSKGKPMAVVRFDSPVVANILEKVAVKNEEDNTKTIKINETDAVAVPIEGDEESEYWKNIAKSKKEAKQKSASRKGWQNRGGRHGRGGGRGRFNDRNRKHRGRNDQGGKAKNQESANGDGD